jgi:hypothetical protein
LVTVELERRWNAKLEECVVARAEIDKHVEAHREIDEAEVERIRDLGARFQDVWNHPECSQVLKKKILRTVLEEIVC